MMKKIYKTPIIEILAEEEALLAGTSGEISKGEGNTGGGGHGLPSQGKGTFTFIYDQDY